MHNTYAFIVNSKCVGMRKGINRAHYLDIAGTTAVTFVNADILVLDLFIHPSISLSLCV